MYRIFQMITHGIGICLLHRIFRNIKSRHIGSICDSCIQCKRSHMCKTVQNSLSFTDPLHCQPVILLVQEKARLLTIYHIDQIVHAIFRDLHLCIKCFPNKSFYFRKSPAPWCGRNGFGVSW